MPASHPTRSAPARSTRALVLITGIGLLALRADPSGAGSGFWTGVSPRAKSIEAIARDPLNPSRLWAASFGSGIYRSLDGGTTWTNFRAGLTNTFVRSLAVEPNHPDSIFCGTNDGVFLSVDGGATWIQRLSTAHSVRGLAIHPVRTGVIYAATFGGGIYKSVNGGSSWATINLGLVSTMVRDVAMNPARPETLMAATSTGGGVHRSFNGGLTWTQLADTTGSLNGTHGAAESVRFDPLDPQRVYVAEVDRGVLKSADGGDTWLRINRGLTSFRGRSIAVVDTLRYFGTDGAGAFFTTLNDTLWHAVNTGLTSPVVDGLLCSATSPSLVLAGTDGGGIFRTTNRGASWSQLDGGLLATFSFSLAVRPSNREVYDGAGFGDQFWRSADQGATWTRESQLFSRDSEHGVAPDPLLANTVYLSAYGGGVYASTDDGITWSNPDSLNHSLLNLFVRPLLAWPGQSGHLFVGTGIGPFESTDGGASWVSRVGNLPASFGVHSMALVPGTPPTLFAGSDTSGVYRSADGGSSWLAKNAGLSSRFVHALVVDASNRALIYAATDSGVFRSANGGDLWTRASTGLPAFEVHALVQDAAHSGALFAGSFGGGVFESVDGANTWRPVANQNGLSNLNVRALALDVADRTVYAGTDDGVAVCSGYGALDAHDVTPATLRLAIWPNPTRSAAVRVAYELTRGGAVRIEVFGVTGERLRVLEDGVRPPGRHEASWDGLDDARRPARPGLYFLRLSAPEGVRTARLARLAR